MKTALEQLREVIDELTKTQTVAIRQESEGEVFVTKALVQPLIGQLREAIAGSISEQGQGSSLPSERNMLDSDALELYDRIEIGARKLLKHYSPGAIPFLLPEQDISQAKVGIHNQFAAGKLDEQRILGITRTLRSWRSQIERIVSPPTSIEWLSPCPVCEATEVQVGVLGQLRSAIIIEFHKPDSEFDLPLSKSVASCGNCYTKWLGDYRLRELRYFGDNQAVQQ